MSTRARCILGGCISFNGSQVACSVEVGDVTKIWAFNVAACPVRVDAKINHICDS